MRFRSFAPVLFLSLAAALPAHAGSIQDAADNAEQRLQSNDPQGAITALESAIEDIWAQMPLTIRKALFVDEAEGYGIYSERESAIFKKDEPLLVYIEPMGFAYGRNALGNREISLTADFELQNTGGDQLFQQDNFIGATLPVRYKNREFQMKMTVLLKGLSAGHYLAKFHLRDQHSEKSVDFELPFETTE